MNIKDNKEEFIRLLKSTNREGVDDLISDLESEGFFTAPASAGHHLKKEGGLVEHSLNVCKIALMLREQMKQIEPVIETECPEDSVIIASLLHDVCKANIYKKTIKTRKSKIGGWEQYDGYKCSYRDFPMGHGEKSVIMILCSGLEMTDAEMLAIRWHMGPWELPMQSVEAQKNYDIARKLHPLCVIVQSADGLAASVMETTAEDLEDL